MEEEPPVLEPSSHSGDNDGSQGDVVVPASSPKPKPPLRHQLVRELLDTEKVHVAQLAFFVREFVQPLRRGTVLTTEQLQKIITNIELIESWNAQFYSGLKSRLKYDLDRQFGDLLLHMVPMLRQLYSEYNEHYQTAIKAYEVALKSRKEFAEFVAQKREMSDCKDFLTYMYLPIQRMMAYDSLVKDILAVTPKDSADHRNLSRALKALRALTKHAEERAVQRKNIDRVLALQEMLGDSCPSLALPHRRQVYEGNVRMISDKGAVRDRYLVLFNDMFLCAKGKRWHKKEIKLEVDWMVGDLHTLRMEDVESDSDPYLFRMVTHGQAHTFSSPDKNAWIELTQATIKRLDDAPQLDQERTETEAGAERDVEFYESRILEWSRSSNAEAVLMEICDLAATLDRGSSEPVFVADVPE